MDLNKNYYDILGIDKNSDEQTIKKAFKKLAKEYHPDRNPNDKAKEEKFKKINEAHQILTEKRGSYDQQSPHGKDYNPSYGGFSGFGDMGGFTFDENFINSVFGGFGYNPFNKTKQENLDIIVNSDLTLSDVYSNNPLSITYKRYVKCGNCKGTGFDFTSTQTKCPSCHGSGLDNYGLLCQTCFGNGNVHSKKCSTCNGERLVIKNETFNLDNIYRIKQSSTQYLQHYGHYSKYYNKVGDLKLNINYKHNEKYEFTTYGLLYTMDVHFQDAIDGNPITYIHLDNSTLAIKIPKGTKNGDLIKLKEKGMLINRHQRGDLIIKINIVIDYSRIKNE